MTALHARMAELGLTSRDVAIAAGVRIKYVVGVRNGSQPGGRVVRARIAKALNVPVAQLWPVPQIEWECIPAWQADHRVALVGRRGDKVVIVSCPAESFLRHLGGLVLRITERLRICDMGYGAPRAKRRANYVSR